MKSGLTSLTVPPPRLPVGGMPVRMGKGGLPVNLSAHFISSLGREQLTFSVMRNMKFPLKALIVNLLSEQQVIDAHPQRISVFISASTETKSASFLVVILL